MAVDIDVVLDELGRRFGIGSLKLNDRGMCRLLFDERLTIDVELDAVKGVTLLHGVVTSIASDLEVEAYEELMSANLFGIGGEDNYFGLDLRQREVVVFTRLANDRIDYEFFAARLESLVNDMETWIERFERGEIGSPRHDVDDAGTTEPDANDAARRGSDATRPVERHDMFSGGMRV